MGAVRRAGHAGHDPPGTETVAIADYFAGLRLKWLEKQFQAEVIKQARQRGWTHIYHTYFSDRSEKGYPDLHMLRAGESIFVELKTMKGGYSPAQIVWRDGLIAAGCRYYLWRPCCWNSGEIFEVLD